MTRTYTPPDFRRMIDNLRQRVERLERRQRTTAETDSSHEIIFSYAGPLTATESPPVRVRRGGSLSVLAVTMATAGSTGTVIDVLRNGAVAATVTVPASTETYNAAVGARFVADIDVLSLEITSVGTGAAEMTAEARFT